MRCSETLKRTPKPKRVNADLSKLLALALVWNGAKTDSGTFPEKEHGVPNFHDILIFVCFQKEAKIAT